jgi:hypothetical protein
MGSAWKLRWTLTKAWVVVWLLLPAGLLKLKVGVEKSAANWKNGLSFTRM